MMEFNLSEKLYGIDENWNQAILIKDVKEFIKQFVKVGLLTPAQEHIFI